MGRAPRCGLLKTPAVNTVVLMLTANLHDCRLARTLKQHLGQNNWSGCIFPLAFEWVFASVQLFHAELSRASNPDCTLASVLPSAGFCSDVLTLISADGWLKILPVVVARIQGFKDGGWANEGRGGRRAFLLIPLKRENVQAPFAELSCAEV